MHVPFLLFACVMATGIAMTFATQPYDLENAAEIEREILRDSELAEGEDGEEEISNTLVLAPTGFRRRWRRWRSRVRSLIRRARVKIFIGHPLACLFKQKKERNTYQ